MGILYYLGWVNFYFVLPSCIIKLISKPKYNEVDYSWKLQREKGIYESTINERKDKY